MARDLGVTALVVLACFAVAVPVAFAIAWTFAALGLGYIVPPVCP
jgi:hypothetical protein